MALPRTAREALAALELLHQLPDGQPIGDVHRATLQKWTGWGPLAPALGFDVADEWVDAADRLESLLDADALTAARELCDTSFFTPPAVADAAFTMLTHSGFTGGRVLEPGCGSGSLMGAAPESLDITWTGIDADPTAARIARLLNPGATIHTAKLEKKHLPESSFDAVIANVPFSAVGVHDSAFSMPGSDTLHGYFIARALHAVKPGGYVAVITSRYYLDSIDLIRKSVLNADANLISALRLPAGIFDGTQVVADLLLLRKTGGPALEPGNGVGIPLVTEERPVPSPGLRPWMPKPMKPMVEHERHAVPHENPDHAVKVSALWTAHPELVAGTLEATGYAPAPLTVRSTDRAADLQRALTAALGCYQPEVQTRIGELTRIEDVPLADADGRKEGSFHAIDGSMHQVVGGSLQPVNRPSKELFALVELRDAVLELLALESDVQLPDAQIQPVRAHALEAYAGYVAKFGPIGRGTLHEGAPDPETGMPTYTWRRPPLGGFRKDPDYFTVLAAENFDQETGDASPAPILRHRVNRAPNVITRTDSPAEAARLASTRDGVIDTARAAELLGADEAAVRDLLAEHAFEDQAGRLICASDYLSGNIREKLAAAEAAGLERNAAALRDVLPAQVGPLEIRAQLGANWIDPSFVESFLNDVLKTTGKVDYVPGVGVWTVDDGYCGDISASTAYGTPKITPARLLELALNNAAPVIYDEHWDRELARNVREKDSAATLAAEEKQNAIKTRFESWVWEEQGRSQTICDEFNLRFRSHRPRRGAGAHLDFPGLSSDITLWPHQKDAIDRIISGRRTILNHAVGAGKTLEAIVGAMKLKQLGLAQKPLITVPNHLIEQIAREARTAYPTGRFLIAGREEVAKDAKRLFAARCAMGDWDIVIMTHTAFTSIPVDADLEQRWVFEKKAELEDVLVSYNTYASRKSQKKVATAIRRLEKELDKLRDDTRRDADTITFEQLGIDHVGVDEVHLFRRLMVVTGSQSGFSLGHSKRATDLDLKIRSLAERHPDRPVFAGFTGTLVSNTLAEVFVWQTYTQPERLAAAGVSSFDAWAASFVQFETAVEVKPTGQGFHMRRRPRKIRNARALASMLAETCDTVTAEQIGLDRPDFTVHNIVSKPTPQQQEVVQALSERADRIYAGGVDPRDDNMLAICGEGRALALDPALVGVGGGSASLQDTADRIAKHYEEGLTQEFPGSPRRGVLQLALCDLGTPKPHDTATYGRLRTALVRRGVPADMIRFVHEASTDKARAALFAQCRSGEVAVLIGSTPKVGVGTNIQTRLAAIHHIDAPWTPAEVEQREGRGLRPNNHCAHLDIYRYVTEGTFDALSWEILERKQSSLGNFIAAAADQDEFDDISDATLSYGEVKALATGRPELLRLAQLNQSVQRLTIMKSVWAQQVNAAHARVKELQFEISHCQSTLKALQQASDAYDPERAGTIDYFATEGVALVKSKPRQEQKRATPSFRIFGLDASIVHHRVSGDVELVLESGYRTALEIALPKKLFRRGRIPVRDAILDALSGLDQKITRAAGTATQMLAARKTELTETQAFLEGIVFDQEDELAATIAERNALNDTLRAQADAEPVAA